MSEVETSAESPFRTLLLGAGAVVLAVLILAGYDGSRDLARLKAREARLQARLDRSEVAIGALREKIENLRSNPYALERAAREDLGLVRPGEIVILLPEAESVPDLEQDP